MAKELEKKFKQFGAYSEQKPIKQKEEAKEESKEEEEKEEETKEDVDDTR